MSEDLLHLTQTIFTLLRLTVCGSAAGAGAAADEGSVDRVLVLALAAAVLGALVTSDAVSSFSFLTAAAHASCQKNQN